MLFRRKCFIAKAFHCSVSRHQRTVNVVSPFRVCLQRLSVIVLCIRKITCNVGSLSSKALCFYRIGCVLCHLIQLSVSNVHCINIRRSKGLELIFSHGRRILLNKRLRIAIVDCLSCFKGFLLRNSKVACLFVKALHILLIRGKTGIFDSIGISSADIAFVVRLTLALRHAFRHKIYCIFRINFIFCCSGRGIRFAIFHIGNVVCFTFGFFYIINKLIKRILSTLVQLINVCIIL